MMSAVPLPKVPLILYFILTSLLAIAFPLITKSSQKGANTLPIAVEAFAKLFI